jgi:acyl-CoA synthetase (AMP-forming)/AMP-acid ligase II
MYLTQPIKRNAQLYPDKVATCCGSRRHTWTELVERVAKLAGALQKLGIKPGDRIAILALNSDRYYEYFFAVPWMGAVLVPLNIRWSIKENVYSLEDSGSTVLIVDDAYSEAAGAILQATDCVRAVIYAGEGDAPEGMLDYEAILTAAAPAEDALRGYSDLAGIFYTGGTTGFPKGVMLSHQNLWSSSISIMAEMGFQMAGTTYLHSAPMFHLADAAMSIANTIAGSTHAFISSFEPVRFMDAVAEYRVTDALLVPTMISMMLASPAMAQADLSSLRKIIYGASPMPEGTLRQIMEIMSHVDFYQPYGQTELAPIATILGPEYHVLDGPKAGRLRSAGRAAHCVELKIVDSVGNTLPSGGVGEVAVRGPNTMLGYWNNPELTKAAFVDGWVMTGDAGYLDEEGFLFLVDRLKDMIVSGGENVFSAEVESVITKHPAVREVVVLGIPCEQWGEAVHAIVRLTAEGVATQQDIIDHCRIYIAGYKCPRSVVFREEPFPLTGAGKVRKVELRKPYWEGRGGAI